MDYQYRHPKSVELFLVPHECKHESRRGRRWLKIEKYVMTPEIAMYMIDSIAIATHKKVPFDIIERLAARLTHLAPEILNESKTPNKKEILFMMCGGKEMLVLHHKIINKEPVI